MAIPVLQIDAFADRPFEGNPAAVCLLPQFPDEEFMQKVAREMNLSETAFVVPGNEGYMLRWFTPNTEVDLCGHATLAAAHALFEQGRTTGVVRFSTRSGILSVEQREDGRLAMDFPSEPVEENPMPEGLDAAIGAPIVYFGRNRMDALVQVGDAGWVRTLEPDLAWISGQPWRGLVVTAPADDENYDCVSRTFYPACGVPEDPVTGSAHCALAPYWSERLGKTDLMGYQASERGGTVVMQHRGDRVTLIGSAVTVMRAELLVEP